MTLRLLSAVASSVGFGDSFPAERKHVVSDSAGAELCSVSASGNASSRWKEQSLAGAMQNNKTLPRKKVQTWQIAGLHLLLMATILRQLVTNLIPPYQAARSQTPVR